MAFLWWRHFWMVPNLYMWIWVSVFICVGEWVNTYLWTYISVFSFDLSILMFFFSFLLFSFSPFFFRLDLRKHNENNAFLPVLCYPSHCWCYSFLSAVIFQLQVLYLDFWPVRFFCFCFCFCFVFLLRLIFRPNKFLALYGFFWLVFVVKQNLLN